jgi:hypothetical protein
MLHKGKEMKDKGRERKDNCTIMLFFRAKQAENEKKRVARRHYGV